MVKGVRSNLFVNSFGLIHINKSEQARAKYINIDGSYTTLGNSWVEKLKPVREELDKLGTNVTVWTDWIVQ